MFALYISLSLEVLFYAFDINRINWGDDIGLSKEVQSEGLNYGDRIYIIVEDFRIRVIVENILIFTSIATIAEFRHSSISSITIIILIRLC